MVLAAGLKVPDPVTVMVSPAVVGPHIVPPFGEAAVFAGFRSNE
jgi:hypothetical protein